MRKVLLLLLCCLGTSEAQLLTIANSNSCVPVVIAGGGLFTDTTFSTFSLSTGTDTLTLNALASPACTTTAATLKEGTATSSHSVFHAFTATITAAPHTFSVYAKRVTGTRNIELAVYTVSFSAGIQVFFNPATCALVTSSSYGTFTAASNTATAAASGYCLVTSTATPAANTTLRLEVDMANGSTDSYTGDGSSTAAIWGVDYR